jgi:hypothetical protein
MKQLTDHREATSGARLSQFLRLARDRSETAWARVWRKPRRPDGSSRRLVEFLRIERGRES